jgi:colicin import membrane protein
MEFVPSPTYQYKVNHLIKERFEGSLTEEEYAEQIEKLIEEETLRSQSAAETMIRQILRKDEKDKMNAVEGEAKKEQEKARREEEREAERALKEKEKEEQQERRSREAIEQERQIKQKTRDYARKK